jgi:GDP-L-fucose synthase
MILDAPDSPVYVAGHKGLVGSAILRKLQAGGHRNLITKTSQELDLRDQQAVTGFFARERPEYVFLSAAKVGGILANNTYPADFIRDNLQIELNVIDAAWRHGVRKLLFLGSSCIYPRASPQPITEEMLLTGALEPTNEPYAIAKIAGLKLCQSYRRQYQFDAISLMPTNLYGPGDNFNLESSHVLPALLRRIDDARESGAAEVVIWGTGTPRREFLHVDDLADACVHAMRHYSGDVALNTGTGEDVAIGDLARLICDVVGYRGELRFDTTKPDGTPRKLLDVSKFSALGWKARIGLREGIEQTWRWYREHREDFRR